LNKKILVIIQRSNGDVFFSWSLISNLLESFQGVDIDMLVNEDTVNIAKTMPNIRRIISFSYERKRADRFTQEREILRKIFRKYDYSINLTASDRSVLYAIFASKYSISAIESSKKKNFWKRFFLKKYYYFSDSRHILENNFMPLKILNISHKKIVSKIPLESKSLLKIKKLLDLNKIGQFLIFHPAAQYEYKIYPEDSRLKLLNLLNKLNAKIVITGGSSRNDLKIKKCLPKLDNIVDLIGQTSFEEYMALSELSIGYIGMDTVNMHIAASQNKKVFAIYGPTNTRMWSPWSNITKSAATNTPPLQQYGNVTLFQANLNCVPCGKAGCNNLHDESICLNYIDPELIYKKVKESI